MQRNDKANVNERPRIVDVIAEGLSLVIARPWLLAVPLLVDLFFWIGVKIEPRALMESLIRLVNDVSVENSEDVVTSLQDLASSNMSQIGAFFVPSMLSGVSRGKLYELTDPPVWSPGSSGLVFLVAIGLVLVGTLLSMAYSVPIANAILGRKQTPAALVGSIFKAWFRLLLFLLIAAGALLVIVIGSSIIGAVFAIAGIDFLPLISSVLLVAGLAALFYGYFVFDAIVVANAGPISAIRYSATVVHRNVRAAIGLILVTILLTTGIPDISETFLDEPPGLLIAVLLHAVIATGAAAASMIFFVDRLRQWRPELLQLPQSAPAFDLTRQGETRP